MNSLLMDVISDPIEIISHASKVPALIVIGILVFVAAAIAGIIVAIIISSKKRKKK